MTYYSYFEVTLTNDEWVTDYVKATTDLIPAHGGRIVARTSKHETLEGDRDRPAMRVLVEWKTRENALAFMNDPEYAPHLAARTAGSVSHHALFKAQDDVIS